MIKLSNSKIKAVCDKIEDDLVSKYSASLSSDYLCNTVEQSKNANGLLRANWKVSLERDAESRICKNKIKTRSKR